MKILAHRGYWKLVQEQNSLIAFEQAWKLGVGIETDLRDCNGDLVIAHDLPSAGALAAEDFFRRYTAIGSHTRLALNIKADGLQQVLEKQLEKFQITEYFLFDMSVPDALHYVRTTNLRLYTRQSEIETVPSLYDQALGIWLDMFVEDWVTEAVVTSHLAQGKEVCIVSPELHKRSHLPFWAELRGMNQYVLANIALCTDFPEDALEFFEDY